MVISFDYRWLVWSDPNGETQTVSLVRPSMNIKHNPLYVFNVHVNYQNTSCYFSILQRTNV
jgi:hypothetical protein